MHKRVQGGPIAMHCHDHVEDRPHRGVEGWVLAT